MVLAILALLAPTIFAAPVTFEISDRGVVSLSDGRPLARVAVNMHAPEWAPASVEHSGTAGREGNHVEGSLALPATCQGTLD